MKPQNAPPTHPGRQRRRGMAMIGRRLAQRDADGDRAQRAHQELALARRC